MNFQVARVKDTLDALTDALGRMQARGVATKDIRMALDYSTREVLLWIFPRAHVLDYEKGLKESTLWGAAVTFADLPGNGLALIEGPDGQLITVTLKV